MITVLVVVEVEVEVMEALEVDVEWVDVLVDVDVVELVDVVALVVLVVDAPVVEVVIRVVLVVEVDVVELVDVVALVVLVVDAPVVEVVIRVVLVVEDVLGVGACVVLVVLVVGTTVVGVRVVVVSDEPDATNDATSARVTRSNAVPKHPPSLAMTCTVARVVPASLPVMPVGIAVSFLLALFPAFNDKAPCPAGPDTAMIFRTPSAEASGSLYR
jgi:hypothetical protein